MIIWNNELYHYGIPRRSGRYKWGSGKNPYHHTGLRTKRLIKKYDKLEKKLEWNNKRQDKLNKKLSRPDRRYQEWRARRYEKASLRFGRKRVAMRAQNKLAKGKPLSSRQNRKLASYTKYNNLAQKKGAYNAKKKQRVKILEDRERLFISKMNKIDKKLGKIYAKEMDRDKIKKGKELLEKENNKWLKKISVNETGTVTQKQYDKIYKEYSNFVKKNYKKPYVLTPEERKVNNKVWTKKQYREGIGPLPKDKRENALLISADKKIGKGNRKKRGWY